MALVLWTSLLRRVTEQVLHFLQGLSSRLIVSNLFGLTTNVQKFVNSISRDNLGQLTTGLNNLALGQFALQATTTGSYNIGFGQDSLYENISGNNNVAIGKESGSGLITSSDCICIGTRTGQDTNDTFFNSIAIGYQAKFNASNQIVLGDSTHTLKFAGKVEAPDIVTKSKMKYGRIQGNTNNLPTVHYFDEAC